jgi:hypothetical protein
MRRRRAVFAGMFVLVAHIACSPTKPEAALERSIEQYGEYWASGNLSGVWRMMSPHMQQGNENDQSEFESFVRESGIMVTRIHVRSVRVMDGRAVVRAAVSYRSSTGEALGEELEESEWIWDHGEWLFDGYRTVADLEAIHQDPE